MMLHIPTISTKHFSYKDRSFSTFASDLQDLGRPSRVYDDACDIGFWLQSEKSGKKILFVEHLQKFDDDGDLQYVEYVAHCLYTNPEHLHDLTLVVWND